MKKKIIGIMKCSIAAWVMTCCELGAEWIKRSPIEGLVTFTILCWIVRILFNVGEVVVEGLSEESTWWQIAKALLIAVGVLYFLTAAWLSVA